MHEGYEDILSRITEKPKWWDANAVPRYDEFHPRYCPDIYSNQVILLRIACQDCGQQFDVEMHAGFFETLNPPKLHYGDPPRHDCPGAGETMNCEDLAVLYVWHRPHAAEGWVRHPELEGLIDA